MDVWQAALPFASLQRSRVKHGLLRGILNGRGRRSVSTNSTSTYMYRSHELKK